MHGDRQARVMSIRRLISLMGIRWLPTLDTPLLVPTFQSFPAVSCRTHFSLLRTVLRYIIVSSILFVLICPLTLPLLAVYALKALIANLLNIKGLTIIMDLICNLLGSLLTRHIHPPKGSPLPHHQGVHLHLYLPVPPSSPTQHQSPWEAAAKDACFDL